MKINKSGDMTPFDMKKRPKRPSTLLLPLMWTGAFFLTRKYGLKITKTRMDGIKPPFLVISAHQGESDYYIAPLTVFPHRASYVSDMEGFMYYGEKLYGMLGCIGKRRFVSDVSVMMNVLHILRKNKDILFIFPEARHSNVGTTALLPKNLGKLAKTAGVPVAVLKIHGSYLASPFWDEFHPRKTKIEAELKLICGGDELKNADENALQKVIEEELQYDEYKWQKENNIRIGCEKRAEGLHLPLYQCISCGGKNCMKSENAALFCEKCGEKWEMSELGELIHAKNGEKLHIPDWYEWERENVKKEIAAGKYGKCFKTEVEALPNSKGFVKMGEGTLIHDISGFRLNVNGKELLFPTEKYESVQTEYNYRNVGRRSIVLSDRDCCYYIYCDDREFQPTELQFAAEELHKIHTKK